jgi:flagellar biosynthesis chaperone FliJ
MNSTFFVQKSTDGVAMSVELQRKVQDYDQLLKEVVKLTTENERLDAHAKSLQSKNNELMAQRKALEQQVHEARAAAALSNADSEIRNRVKTPLNSTVSGSESSVEESREAVQSSIQLWQVLVVAILCLIIGRML